MSCPIKLPPLDGSRFQPGTIREKPVNAIKTESRTRSASEPSPFSRILSDVRASAPGNIPPATVLSEAEEAGTQFEAFFLSLIFKQAFNTQISSSFYGDSYAPRMYLEMFIDAAAEEAARTNPLGIAKLIAEDINRDEPE